MNRPVWLWIVFIASLLAMIGSLYFGYFWDPLDNLHSGIFFDPSNGLPICVLCRYTRIAIYPIVFLSGIALIRNDRTIWIYILPLIIVGLIVSLYQNAIIIIPTITSWVCDLSNPCTIGYLHWLGFITIPLLALGSLITILAATIYWAYSSTWSHEQQY